MKRTFTVALFIFLVSTLLLVWACNICVVAAATIGVGGSFFLGRKKSSMNRGGIIVRLKASNVSDHICPSYRGMGGVAEQQTLPGACGFLCGFRGRHVARAGFLWKPLQMLKPRQSSPAAARWRNPESNERTRLNKPSSTPEL
jgi:hypothetical protein